MHINDHDPPHIHARYGEYRVRVTVHPLEVSRGGLPASKQRLLLAWVRKRNSELREAWDLIQNGQTAERIAP